MEFMIGFQVPPFIRNALQTWISIIIKTQSLYSMHFQTLEHV